MIKALLFDYDGVMTAPSGGGNPSDRLAKLLNLTAHDASLLFTSFWHDYLRGKINETDLWKFIELKTGKSVPSVQRTIWTKGEQLQPLPQMVQFIGELRAKGYQVGLLTNVTPTTEKEVRAHGGYDGFDFLIRSCKVGFAKPDPEIYALALQQCKDVKPSEAVFIDDRERFLAPAREIGIHTILAQSTHQVMNNIKSLL